MDSILASLRQAPTASPAGPAPIKIVLISMRELDICPSLPQFSLCPASPNLTTEAFLIGEQGVHFILT